MKSITVATAVTVCLLLTACGDPKKPSETKFAAAIQKYLDENSPCIGIDITKNGQFPGEVEVNRYNEDSMQPLLNSGLFTLSNETEQRRGFGGAVKKYTVDLSDTGRKALSIRHSELTGDKPQVCYGKYKVGKIVRFTEPGDVMGMTISRVTYERAATDIADWAKRPQMQNAFSTIKKDIEAAQVQTDALVLTNEGWIHERMMRK